MTELIFILDRSGSMETMAEDTVGGFNTMIEKQKQEPGEALVTTILFNQEAELLHDRIPLEEVPRMTADDYMACGCTALLDAVGGAIRHIAGIHRYIRPEDRPERTLFVITTDGIENVSHHYTYSQVKGMITKQRKEHGWEFLFFGANIDVPEEAARLGIDEDCAASYHSDTKGTSLNYETITNVVRQVRQGKRLDSSWKHKIDEDFIRRC